MSTQIPYPTISLGELAGGETTERTGARTPTAQELLEAMMRGGAAAPSGNTPAIDDAKRSTPVVDDAKLYRGRSTAELIPKIQAELGPQAIVTKRRSGLEGGIGGFFQRPFVEIEAHRGHAGVDICAGADAFPAALQRQPDAGWAAREEELLEEPHPSPTETLDMLPGSQGEAPHDLQPPGLGVISAPDFMPAPSTFAATLEDAEAAPSAREAGPSAPSPSVAAAKPSRAGAALRSELAAKGFSEPFVAALLEEAETHVLPFAPRIGRRRAVRIALERRIPKATPLAGSGASIGLVGPGGAGKTTCQKALAARYRQGALPVTCAALASDPASASLQLIASPATSSPPAADSKGARVILARAREKGIVLLDTPSFSPADAVGTKALAGVLGMLALERFVIVAPATMGAAALARLLRASAPFSPSALAITHVEESEQLGIVIEAACDSGLAPEYLLSAARAEPTLTRTDPSAIASTLLP